MTILTAVKRIAPPNSWLQRTELYVLVLLLEAAYSNMYDEEPQAPPQSFTTSWFRSALRCDDSGAGGSTTRVAGGSFGGAGLQRRGSMAEWVTRPRTDGHEGAVTSYST